MRPLRGKRVGGMGCLPSNLEKLKANSGIKFCVHYIFLSDYSGQLLTCLHRIKDEKYTMAAD